MKKSDSQIDGMAVETREYHPDATRSAAWINSPGPYCFDRHYNTRTGPRTVVPRGPIILQQKTVTSDLASRKDKAIRSGVKGVGVSTGVEEPHR